MARDYGDWEVIESINEGGQARVFLVEDSTGAIPGKFALKRLKNAKRLDRFKQEIEAIKGLAHPNIVSVVAYDVDSDAPYYVSELCERGSLVDVGPDQFKGNVEATVYFLLPLVSALRAAHGAGVIHRDVKPSNILVRADGTPALADFGICHIDNGERFTLSDEPIGSTNYIAPEMESGRHGQPTDRTDVYSLAKVIYWMVSGGRIFSREDHRRNYLPKLLGDERFEHVHWLLDSMVKEDPNDRRHMDVIHQGLEALGNLVKRNAAPLRPSMGITCRFCGAGTYRRFLAPNGGIPVSRVGLTTFAGMDLRVLRCSSCGHLESFDFVDLENRDWWGN